MSTPATSPKGHAGWRVFTRTLAVILPTQLRRSAALRRQALKRLGAPSNLR